MNPLARLRHVLARRPWLYWLAIAAVAVSGALVAARAVTSVEAARDEWGAPRTVLVATASVSPGEAIAGVVERRAVPGPIVPAGALGELPDAAVARQRIAAGEIIVEHDVAATADPQARIPPGWHAVAVAEPVASGADVGDEVVAVAGGVVLAASGVVVGTPGGSVLVAVPAPDAPAVAMAATTGELTLLLTR